METFMYWLFLVLAVVGVYALFGWMCALLFPQKGRVLAFRLTGKESEEELRALLLQIQMEPKGEMSAVLLLPASPSSALMQLLSETQAEKYLPFG